MDQGDDFFPILIRRSRIGIQVGIDVGHIFLVGKNGDAELLSEPQGGMMLMDNLAPVISLFEYDAFRLDG